MVIHTDRPPMGWNSWNAYLGAPTYGSPSEDDMKASMRYMAQKLLPHGYVYFTTDARWYVADVMKDGAPEQDTAVDRYGRPLPHPARYPSARENGFAAIADYAHHLGLKFGLHMMRGMNTFMLGRGCVVKGTDTPLEEVIDYASPCSWNSKGWYGVKIDHPAAQAWYDSLFENFAAWGVDFVKYDDLGAPLHPEEIMMIESAIAACGRDMVLSLSPGSQTKISDAAFYSEHATMWRISGDFWDSWTNSLRRSFDLLALWNARADAPGWPDADMIPLGWLTETACDRGVRPRPCRFTLEEKQSLFTLFSIARSPLILTCSLLRNDDALLAIQTQPDCLAVNQRGEHPRVLRCGENEPLHIWRSRADGHDYLALFNLSDTDGWFGCRVPEELAGRWAIDVWNGDVYTLAADMRLPIAQHGVLFLRIH